MKRKERGKIWMVILGTGCIEQVPCLQDAGEVTNRRTEKKKQSRRKKTGSISGGLACSGVWNISYEGSNCFLCLKRKFRIYSKRHL